MNSLEKKKERKWRHLQSEELAKEMKELYCENYKTSMKEIKNYKNKWKIRQVHRLEI